MPKEATAVPGEAEIMLYGDVGYEISAFDVVARLKGLAGQPVCLAINSAGGDVFEAQAIYAAVRRHGASLTTARIDGLAASAASWIAVACGTVVVAPGAWLMVHKPHASAYGVDTVDIAQIAAQLDMIEKSMRQAYCAKTGLPDEEVAALLAASTWMDATTAVGKGFADAIEEGLGLAARTVTHAVLGRGTPREVAARLHYRPSQAQTDELRARNLAAARGGDGPPLPPPPPEGEADHGKARAALALRRARALGLSTISRRGGERAGTPPGESSHPLGAT